jgi:hypothetical protein
MYVIMMCRRLFREKKPSRKWHTKDTEEDRQRVLYKIESKRVQKYNRLMSFRQDEFQGFTKMDKGWNNHLEQLEAED